MSATCEIYFENSPSKVLFSGQLIKGNLIVKLNQSIFVRGVYLRLHGEGYCKFFWQSGKVHRRPEATETHLNEEIICIDGTENNTRLEAGIYRCPFECQLPESIPTSLEEDDEYGYESHIRYTASIRFDESLDTTPVHDELFTVIRPLNLNFFPKLNETFAVEFKKRFRYCCCCCCCCILPFCQSNEIKMVARIPQQGYVPGQVIDLQIDVQNKSSEDVRAMKVKFIKKIANTAINSETEFEYTREKLKNLYKQRFEGCYSSKKDKKIYQIALVVPSTPPSDENSKIVKISYQIVITAIVGSCHDDPEIEIPITIGTHPIVSETYQIDEDQPSPEFDSPTYEEPVYCENDKRDGFKPKYLVYRRAD